MSRTRVDVGLVKRAATWSYIMGVWELVSVVVLFAAIISLVFPLVSMSGGISSLTQIFDSVILAVAIVLAITIPITMIFGYYMYKVGGQYDVGSLKVTGISAMIMGIGYPVALLGLYTFFNALTSIPLSPSPSPADIYSILGSLEWLILGAGVLAIFGLIFFISFIIGASGMKSRTSIDQFGSAMVLAIVGIFTGVTFPIGIILFGSALKKAVGQEGTEKIAKPGASQEVVRTPGRRGPTYCPYCGAKIEPDSLFCPSCGSSLKKEE